MKNMKIGIAVMSLMWVIVVYGPVAPGPRSEARVKGAESRRNTIGSTLELVDRMWSEPKVMPIRPLEKKMESNLRPMRKVGENVVGSRLSEVHAKLPVRKNRGRALTVSEKREKVGRQKIKEQERLGGKMEFDDEVYQYEVPGQLGLEMNPVPKYEKVNKREKPSRFIEDEVYKSESADFDISHDDVFSDVTGVSDMFQRAELEKKFTEQDKVFDTTAKEHADSMYQMNKEAGLLQEPFLTDNQFRAYKERQANAVKADWPSAQGAEGLKLFKNRTGNVVSRGVEPYLPQTKPEGLSELIDIHNADKRDRLNKLSKELDVAMKEAQKTLANHKMKQERLNDRFI